MLTIKHVLASIVFGLVLIVYVAREAQTNFSRNLNYVVSSAATLEKPKYYKKTDDSKPIAKIKIPQDKKPIAVFLVTQCRSGSSILGELFNRRVGVTYLYEPLYPFRESNCHPATGDLVPMSVGAVEDMARCKFSRLPDLYWKGFRSSKQGDAAGCVRNNICFLGCEKCDLFMRRDAPEVKRKFFKADLVKLEQHCEKSEFFAAKLNYLAGIRNITHLLTSEDVNVKIIHLTRDPRATTRSLLQANDGMKGVNKARNAAKEVCKRLTDNANFVHNEKQAAPGNLLSIRHEDFAINPLETVQTIYDFIGRPPTQKLLSWVKSATDGYSGKQQHQLKFGTARNATLVITAWRSWFNYEEVAAIQEVCGDALKLLNYKIYSSDSELKDLSVPSF